MFKKIRKSRITFLLFSITVFIALYNLYRKNYEIEFEQPLVKSELYKSDNKKSKDYNAGVGASSQEEGGGEGREDEEAADNNEESDLKQDFGIDGDIRAAVDNLGSKKKKQVNAGKPAVAEVENGGEFYND